MIEGEKPAGRSARKRRVILGAARSTFLAKGYDGTSMDEIALSAAVSKPTIYKHFGDKEQLFAEAIMADIADAEANTLEQIEALPATQDLEADLRRFARQHVVDVMQPELVRMRRQVIAEAERFPTLAATWYERGPATAHAVLASVFSSLADRGLLQMDDPLLAAEQFNQLVLMPLNRVMFIPTTGIDSAELNRIADEAVAVFLAAYGSDGRTPEPRRRSP